MASIAEGVVVGSALVDCLANHGGDATLQLTRQLAAALDSVSRGVMQPVPELYRA